MLYKDVLRIIFERLCPKAAKTARLVCHLWDTEIRKRFNVFHANQKSLYYPEYCDEIVCFNSDIPIPTKNIKRVHLYKSSFCWEFDIDTLFIYCDSISSDDGQASIRGNITNLIIGIYENPYSYIHSELHVKLTPQNNCSEIINEILSKTISDVKGVVCITSATQVFSRFVLAKVIYIKPTQNIYI